MAGYLVAQLSDLHIVEPGRLLAGEIDTARHLADAVAHLGRLDPAPDVVLVTGDLTESGRPAQYEHLVALLAPLQPPVWLLPGNHDEVVALRERGGWTERAARPDRLDGVIDGLVRIVCLDTLRPGEAGGRLDPEQVAWLDEVLSAHPDRPTMVALHHPPFATGIAHMDAMALDAGNADALGAVIERHPQVERVLCGHLHRTIVRRWHGTLVMTAPGAAHAVALDLRDDSPAAWNREPPGVVLHWWTPDTGLVTHVQAIGEFPATPFA